MRRHTILELSLFLNISVMVLAQTAAPSHPQSLGYVLQAEALGKSRQEAIRRLADCGRDWIVIDRLFDGGDDGEYTAAEINLIRNAQPNRKVFAYISIGEAEDYRPYWKREWDADRNGRPDEKAPSWLGAENPDWKGNYRVHYWHKDWQNIVLAQMDRAILAGFDGVYLDIVDAFETFEYNPVKKDWIDHRVNKETGQSYRKDMIRWIRGIAAHTRKQKPSFFVIPQNGSQLLVDADYLSTIDAIGIEDLFTDGKRAQKREHTQHIVDFLDRLKPSAKPILVIEYGTQPALMQISDREAGKKGYVLLITDRKLKTLGRSGVFDGKGK